MKIAPPRLLSHFPSHINSTTGILLFGEINLLENYREEHKSNTSKLSETGNSEAIISPRNYRNLNHHKLKLALINVNSGNQFDITSQHIRKNMNILAICETKRLTIASK